MSELFNNFSNIISNNMIIAMLVTLLGGIISSFSPCTLSTFPLIIGYLNLNDKKNDLSKKNNNLILALCFSLGIIITFSALGVISSLIGYSFRIWGKFWYLLLAIILLIVSLQSFKIINIKKYCKIPILRKNPFSAFLLGILGGIFASPCSTPVLIAILTFIAKEGNIVFGITLMLIYSLGYCAIIFLIGIFGDIINKVSYIEKYNKIIEYLNAIFGIFILLLSFYLFYIVF